MAKKLPKPADRIRTWREDPVEFVRDVFGVEPDAWQLDVLRAFPNHPRQAMKAPVHVDAEVPTPCGDRRWGDVQVGDALFAEDGSVTRVVRRFDVGRVPLYRVTFRDGSSLRVSADHEWDVLTPLDRANGRRRTVSTAELAAMRLRDGAGQRLVSIPQHGAAQYPAAELPADPYVFGLWLGDGVASEPRLIAPDPAIRKAVLARGVEITESEAVPKRIGLPGYAQRLRETGVFGCRSHEKRIPALYLRGSVEQRMLLLRGMMDADGTCAQNGHTYLATSSQGLAEDFAWLARSLGYVSRVMGPYKINGGENRDSYRVVVTGDVSPFLARTPKALRWRPAVAGKASRFIDSVQPDGEGEAMCVEVDHPSHCFLASDFIVTHNCKGPGKTAVLAWLCWNFLTCYLHPKVAATSVTSDNLADGLWTEMAKWQAKSELLKATFTWTKQRITANDHPETWWMSARTWPKGGDATQQADTLAGLHADNLMFVIDEAGGVPDAVMAAAEAGLANADGQSKHAHIVIAGNPTHLEGPLYRACTIERPLWHVTEITSDPDDPKRTPRVSVEWARQQIEKYGRDNPWVLVNVFGQFPPSSMNALLGPDDVSAAMARTCRAEDIAGMARVLGVDVARFGLDSSVIARRQGRLAYPLAEARNMDSLQGAGWVLQRYRDFNGDRSDKAAHACFIDNTGGWGAGWIDQLGALGQTPIGVGFAGKADDARYFNKRTEIHFRLADWVKSGGCLPNDPELAAELTAMTYVFRGDKLWLEEKEQVREKLGRSPDRADALALTFAYDVVAPLSAESPVALRLASMVSESYAKPGEASFYNPLG